MNWIKRLLYFTVFFIGIAIIIGALSSLLLTKSAITIPKNTREQLAGKTCDWYRDKNGHFHVRADDELAAYSCWGSIHASERGWQMDYFRRVVQGRSAEIHGTPKVKTDFLMRLMGLYEQALELEKDLDAETRDILWAYAFGVNEIFKTPKSPYFNKLRYSPDDWRPADSIALILLQSFDQTRQTFMSELKETERLNLYGEDTIHDYFDDGTPWDTSILKKGEYPIAQTATAKVSPSRLPIAPESINSFFSLFDSFEIGSNNWVLGRRRSESGHVLFSNDPHLGLRTPPFWHIIGVESPNWSVLGASFPGIPVITSGFNQNMAWGLTNAYLDAGRLSFIDQSELKSTQKIRPLVFVKWAGLHWPIFFKTLERTQSKLPLLPLDAPKGKTLVLNWTGYKIKPDNIKYVLNLVKYHSAKDLHEGLGKVGVPSWNFVFGDNTGAIGFRATGFIFKNKIATPIGVSETSLQALEEVPLLTPEEMPQLLKPARDFISSANNRQFPKDSSLHGGYGYRPSFRAYRIEQLLTEKPRHSVETLKSVQCDLFQIEASFILPPLLAEAKNRTLDEESSNAIEILTKWNFQTGLDCQACGIYRRWADRVQDKWNLNEAAFYRRLTSRRSSDFIDSVFHELSLALADIKSATGTAFSTWGELHKIHFRSLAGDKKINPKGAISTPSDENVINPGESKWEGSHYEHDVGASQRLIVELSSPPKAWLRLSGPNSESDPMEIDAAESAFRKWSECTFDEVEFPAKWGNFQTLSF